MNIDEDLEYGKHPELLEAINLLRNELQKYDSNTIYMTETNKRIFEALPEYNKSTAENL